MRLKGVRPINKCIAKYIKKWDLKVGGLDLSFSYLPTKKEVYWTPIVCEKADKEFADFFESLGCEVKADVFIYSLLHEIGHSQTLDEVSDEDYYYSHDRKADEEITNTEYFNLPVEIVATQWAVDYLNTHTEEVAEFWKKLQPRIMNFYAKNHIL